MTSSCTLMPVFRDCLIKMSKELTNENIQDIASNCEHISSTRRGMITNAMELFASLQSHELLHATNVNVLIELLDMLKIENASAIIKDYKNTHLQVLDDVSKRCHTHNKIFKYVCISCNSKLCPDCEISSHKVGTSCDVVDINNVSNEVSVRRKKLMTEAESAITSMETIEKVIEERDQCDIELRENARFEILSKAAEERSNINKKRQDFVDIVRRNEKHITQMKEAKKDMLTLENEVKRLSKLDIRQTSDQLNELYEIGEMMGKNRDIHTALYHQSKLLEVTAGDILYKELCDDETFGSISDVIRNVEMSYGAAKDKVTYVDSITSPKS